MKISIIIPVYHCIDYIEDCLNSVVGQTYQGVMECILVDDCGGDGSVEIAERYIEKQHSAIEFFVIRHDKNRGAAAARNTGLKAAIGDYVYFLDSDDMITPSCLEDLVKMLAKYPNADVIHAGIKTTDGSIPWFDFEKNPFPEYTDSIYEIKVNLFGREVLPASPCSKLIRRELLVQNGITFYEGIVIEDVLWCNILAKYVKSIACINKSSYIYRIHEGSVVTSGMGVDPMRKLIVYGLMIDAIDEPYMKEQVEHLVYQIDKVYFENEGSEIRKEVGRLLGKLLKYCEITFKPKLLIKSKLAKTGKGNRSIPYYIYNQLSMGDGFSNILFRILSRIIK